MQPTRSVQVLSTLSIVCSCISPMASRILVGVTLTFDGIPQIIVQRCQIAAPRWPNDISFAADNAIFKNRMQNIECSFSCVARSAVLLKPNLANILPFNFCQQKFIQHGPITIAIDCNGLSLLKWPWEKWPNYASGPNIRFGCVGFPVYARGFSVPQMRQFCLFTYPPKLKWFSSKNMIFFLSKSASYVSRSVALFYSIVQAYTQPYSFGRRIKLIIC